MAAKSREGAEADEVVADEAATVSELRKLFEDAADGGGASDDGRRVMLSDRLRDLRPRAAIARKVIEAVAGEFAPLQARHAELAAEERAASGRVVFAKVVAEHVLEYRDAAMRAQRAMAAVRSAAQVFRDAMLPQLAIG